MNNLLGRKGTVIKLQSGNRLLVKECTTPRRLKDEVIRYVSETSIDLS